MRSESAQTVEKALEMLNAIFESGGSAPVKLAAERAGISTGSAYRIINALEGKGAVRRLPDGRFALGSLLRRLGSAVDHFPELRLAAAGPMYNLRAQCGMETVGLYRRLNTAEMACIESLPGLHALRNVDNLYEAIPISRGATAQVFLATDIARFGADAVRTYLENLPDGPRPDNIDTTMNKIRHVMQTGIASSVGTRMPEAASLSCPIKLGPTFPNAALTVAGLASRFASAPRAEWSEHLKTTADTIAKAAANDPS